MRASILERLHSVPGGAEVDDLRFVVGDVESLPTWIAAEPVASTKPVRPAAPPPSDLQAAIEQIPDPELRARFAALVGRARLD